MYEWQFQSANEIRARELREDLMRVLRFGGQGDFDAAELIYGELIGNAVRYAPGRINIRLEWGGDTPTLIVHDEGSVFAWSPRLPADPYSECGRGLFIIQQLALDVRVEHVTDDGMNVFVVLPVHRAT